MPTHNRNPLLGAISQAIYTLRYRAPPPPPSSGHDLGLDLDAWHELCRTRCEMVAARLSGERLADKWDVRTGVMRA